MMHTIFTVFVCLCACVRADRMICESVRRLERSFYLVSMVRMENMRLDCHCRRERGHSQDPTS